jgi:hypothetical protein
VGRLAWLILLWVVVDFSNPMLPGSVRFDPSESIEAVHGGTAISIAAPSLGVARQPAPLTLPHRLWIKPSGSARTTMVERRRFLAVRPVRYQPDDLTPALPAEDL